MDKNILKIVSNKFGLITGCGNGIGHAITKNLLTKNKELTILGISRSNNNNIFELQKTFKERFVFKECDISNYEKIDSILQVFTSNFGSFNISICNAGVRSRLTIKESNLNLYRSIIEVNTIANINIAKKMIEISLKNENKCNILFISSIVGGRGFDELSTYAVSKAALEGFMKSAAIEYAKHDIQINCLAPGFIESSYAEKFRKNKKDLYAWTISQTPMGRWGKCEEVAELASFLVSPKNSYMTGTVVYCDGGWTSK